MTQEEKDLLLKDLCSRLPYGVKIQTWYGEIITSDINTFSISINEIDIEQLSGMKPYLRPLSSMTEEEISHYHSFFPMLPRDLITPDKSVKLLDWLNESHFDYRGLIPMGLALEAPKGMYNTKQ